MRSEPRVGAEPIRTCVVCRKRYSKDRMFMLCVDAPGGLDSQDAGAGRLRLRTGMYVCGQRSCIGDAGLPGRAAHTLGRAVSRSKIALVALSPALSEGGAGGGEVLE